MTVDEFYRENHNTVQTGKVLKEKLLMLESNDEEELDMIQEAIDFYVKGEYPLSDKKQYLINLKINVYERKIDIRRF